MTISQDRFGLSWRPALTAGILMHRDRIDTVEVIPGDGLEAGSGYAGSLALLAREMPVSLHSVALGPASVSPVDERRAASVARLCERIRPASWSEHLALVRSGGIEIGHMTAPVRDAATLDSTLANLDRLRRIAGTAPHVENIAALFDPPGCAMTEAEWFAALFGACANGWLLDLHNVHANSLNFGFDARTWLDGLPLDRVRTIHLAGGRCIEDREANRRYLDDHLHAVPDPVYGLLRHVAARAPQPLTVILERDGEFPPMAALLAELDQARAAVAAGRKEVRRPCAAA